MKLTSFIPAMTVLLLAACSQAPSGGDATPGADNTPMPAAEHAPMADQSKPATADMAQSAKTASATGTVEAVDAAAGKITIAHGPLLNLDMPAMTMVFRVKDAAWLDQLQAGRTIRFLADSVNGSLTIVRLEAAK